MLASFFLPSAILLYNADMLVHFMQLLDRRTGRLYLRHGYSFFARRPQYYLDGSDALELVCQQQNYALTYTHTYGHTHAHAHTRTSARSSFPSDVSGDAGSSTCNRTGTASISISSNNSSGSSSSSSSSHDHLPMLDVMAAYF